MKILLALLDSLMQKINHIIKINFDNYLEKFSRKTSYPEFLISAILQNWFPVIQIVTCCFIAFHQIHVF